jgi:predicted ATPase
MADETEASVAPSLKITGLHIAGYRSIKRLDWPEDGLGWDGTVPDIVLVGGANGSGKTTLLEGLFGFLKAMDRRRVNDDAFRGAREFRIDLSVRSKELGGTRALRLAIGDEAFLQTQASPDCYSINPRGDRPRPPECWAEFLEAARNPVFVGQGIMPHVIYFPTDRQLTFPEPSKQSLERPPDPNEMAWRFTPAGSYEESLTSQLYRARFEDLNEKEAGRPERATNFAAYSDAFHRFVGGGKELVWHHANLRVRTSDGATHELPWLSSGEKQVLIFAAELHRRWTPGSLILIDEPELHLHEAWQTTLFELIRDLQRERGGQAIIATQSNHLFGLGDPGTTVVLRKGWP